MKPYPAYKESGIEWLGEIPSKWGMVRLRHLANLINEKANGSSENGLQIALENIEGFTGRLISKGEFGGVGNRFVKGDVLFNKLRPYLCKAVIAPEDGAAVGELLVLRPTNQVINKFLLYRLLSDDFISIVDGSTYGAKMPRASWEFIGDLKIPTPSIEEQRAIADYLDRKTAVIDSLIAKKERQIELLQEQRTAVINTTVTKGLNPHAPRKDSGIPWLGQIPSHWDVTRLKYLTSSISVGIVITPAKYYVDSGVPCLRSLNIKERQIDEFELVYISPESNELLNKSKIFAGDLVAVRTGKPGTTAVVDERFHGANCIDLIIIRQSENFDSDYMCYLLNSAFAQTQYSLGSEGAIQQHFNIGVAKELFAFRIPLDEQKAIVEFLNQKNGDIDKSIQNNQQQIELLREYRTAVISAAVTGKIDVRNI